MTPLGYSESIIFCHSDNAPSQNLGLLVRQNAGTDRFPGVPTGDNGPVLREEENQLLLCVNLEPVSLSHS